MKDETKKSDIKNGSFELVADNAGAPLNGSKYSNCYPGTLSIDANGLKFVGRTEENNYDLQPAGIKKMTLANTRLLIEPINGRRFGFLLDMEAAKNERLFEFLIQLPHLLKRANKQSNSADWLASLKHYGYPIKKSNYAIKYLMYSSIALVLFLITLKTVPGNVGRIIALCIFVSLEIFLLARYQ